MFVVSGDVFAGPFGIFGRRGTCRSFSSCSSSSCFVAPVHHNVFVKEVAIAVPILVPAFQFQYQPAFCSAPVAPAAYPVTSDGISQPPNQNFDYGQQFTKEQIREIAKAVVAELRNMELNGPEDDGPPEIPGGVSNQKITASINNEVASLASNAMHRTCAHCHTGAGSKGDTVIFSQFGVFNPNINWKRITEEVAAGTMPPPKSQFKLTLQEREAIKALSKTK